MQTAALITRRAGTLGELSLIGSERAELRRRNFRELVKAAAKRPQPADAIRDFERGRPTSFEQFTKVETAVLRASKPEAVQRYLGRDVQLACEHIIATVDAPEALIESEEDIEHVANKHQRRLAEYIRTGNEAGLQSIIDYCSQHEIALARMRHAATNAKRALSMPLRFVPTGGQSA